MIVSGFLDQLMPTEGEIISRIKARARGSRRVLVGIGDDAAVARLEAGSDLIACCDLLVEDVHFRAGWAAPMLLGHKALAVTLSDVAAMGAVARFAMVSVAFPPSTGSEFVDDLFRGIVDLADQCDVSIIGGDTSSSPGPLFLDISVIGECRQGQAVTRGGAKAGDIIYVTGNLGASALGLSLLEAGHRLGDETTDARSEARARALLKHLSPEPRSKMGQAIGEAGLATAMIDISDGLSTDLWHVLEESGCGAVIRAASIPIAECAMTLSAGDSGSDPLSLALHGGEEYELLFTSRPNSEGELVELSNSLGVAITPIGNIMIGTGLQLELDDRAEQVVPGGYEHRTDRS